MASYQAKINQLNQAYNPSDATANIFKKIFDKGIGTGTGIFFKCKDSTGPCNFFLHNKHRSRFL
jgi:hypothetical protein